MTEPTLPANPSRDNHATDCETVADDDLPDHLDRCTCDEHTGVCQNCGFKITVGPSGTEYGHGRATNRGPNADGVRRDCIHRPLQCNPNPGEPHAWEGYDYDNWTDNEVRTDGGSRRKGAERFWSRYDIPFEYDTAIKVRLSGLQRGSAGTGHASDTVVHLHVKEPFSEGRLSRSADAFLCENDSHVPMDGREERHVEDGERYMPAVTCETCLDRMERWETQHDGTDGTQPGDSE